MSSTASIAQFMAILSGGSNPSMFRQYLAANEQAATDFESLIGAEGTGKATIPGSELLKNSQSGLLPNTGVTCNGLGLSACPQPADNDSNAEASATATILQFIRQQSSANSGNSIVLNLSEKGIPQNVIDDLQKLFGANDLITILRDPALSAQLDAALAGLGETQSIESHHMADVIGAILNQGTNDDAQKTISVSAKELSSLDDALKRLLDDGNLNTDIYVSIQAIPVVEVKQPLHMALLQQQMNGDGTQATEQALSSVAGAQNPFSMKNMKGLSEKDKASIDQIMQQRSAQAKATGATVFGGHDSNHSIADRLAAITGHENANSKSSSAASDFGGFMLSADGQSLVDSDGAYITPFEAGFKTASQAANPITAQTNAAQAHPASQMLAASLSKMASKAMNGDDIQSYRLKLDPPELGRVDIDMDFANQSGHLKAVISVEKPETLGMLQRDMHVLLKAMQDAGFESMTQQDLSFSLSQGGDTMADGRQNHNHSDGGAVKRSGHNNMDGQQVMLNTQMTLIIDPVTGQRHVNMLV